MNKTIAILPGDGIGPEVMAEAVKVLDAVAKKYGHTFVYHKALVGGSAYDAYGDALPPQTLKVCEEADAVLFGSVGGPKWETLPRNDQPERKALLGIRKHFGLYANLRPSFVFPELASHSLLAPSVVAGGFDIMIVRELIGGIYFGRPREIVGSGDERKAVDTMQYSVKEIERIGRVAFEIARNRSKKLISVDKANVLDCMVLWREVMENLSSEYPDIELSHMYVDNAAIQLVRNPKGFDTIVTGNLFGDILSDLSSVLPGSLGMIPSASLGDGNFGLYEPAGGSAPDIAGQGIANPIAQILSVAMMFKYSFGMQTESDAIENAVKKTLAEGYRTGDIYEDGQTKVGTSEMGEKIVEML